MDGRAAVRIRHLHCDYRVPRDHPEPAQLRAELDTAAERHLSAACSRLLSEVLPQDDDSVWVIRDLNLHFICDAASAMQKQDDIGLHWARELAIAVTRRIRQGPDGGNVLWYPNRAAYLAAFASDMASGTAEAWQYRQFDSVRELPLHAALREAFLRDPVQTASALSLLQANGSLGRVLDSMGEGDIHQILSALAESAGWQAIPPRELAHKVIAVLSGMPLPGDLLASPSGILRVMARLNNAGASSWHAEALGLVAAVLALAGTLRSSREPYRFLYALSSGDAVTARSLWRDSTSNSSDPHPQALIAALDLALTAPECLPLLLEAVRGPETAGHSGILTSPLAGLVLLLPAAAAAGLLPDGADAAPDLVLWTLFHCLPAELREGVLHDPLLPQLLGVKQRPEAARLAGLANEHEWPASHVARHWLDLFTARLTPAFAGSSPSWLAENFFCTPGRLIPPEPQGDTWTLHISPPPLAMILRFAGAACSRFTLPWLPDRDFEVVIDDD